MKSLLVLTLIILLYLPLSLCAQAQKPEKLNEKKEKSYCVKLDEKNGYRGIKLGADISTLSQFGTYFKTANDLWKDNDNGTIDYKFISNGNDYNKISDNINLKDIIVRTHKGKIVSIYLLFNPADGDMIKDIFVYAYGTPQQPDANANKFFWFGKDTTLELIAYGNPSGVAVFTDITLQKEIDALEKPVLSRAAANL